MSTNNGITRFNPVTEVFTNYNLADGLIEAEFNRNHALLLPDGRIAMAGSKGYSVFDPNLFGEDNYTPEVQLTSVSVNDKKISPLTDKDLLKWPVNRIQEIDLSYTQNAIGFEFATTQYNAPEKNRFRYQLVGYDKGWVETEGDRAIRFNQLRWGNYTLLLNASNTNGTWSPSIREIAIVVHPPFWFTWWAFGIYAIIVGLTVRAYWRSYRKKLVEKKEAEFNVREAARLRELDETKSKFFANITHEFRTPLTLILSPLEKHLQDGSLPPKALTLLNNNYRHANQLLRLVNQLLDIAKLEAGQMPVTPAAGELDRFVEESVNSFRTQAQQKGIELEYINRDV